MLSSGDGYGNGELDPFHIHHGHNLSWWGTSPKAFQTVKVSRNFCQSYHLWTWLHFFYFLRKLGNIVNVILKEGWRWRFDITVIPTTVYYHWVYCHISLVPLSMVYRQHRQHGHSCWRMFWCWLAEEYVLRICAIWEAPVLPSATAYNNVRNMMMVTWVTEKNNYSLDRFDTM